MKIIRADGEIPAAPWAGAWRRPRRRSHHWRTIQRSGEAKVAAWEEGESEGNPECSYGTAHQPGMEEDRTGQRWNEGQEKCFNG